MYFDESILRIISGIPDDLDISEEKARYLEVCLQSATEALVVFKALGKEDSDFAEERMAFNSILEDEESDLETALESLSRLRENKEFNELYESYLDIINESLLKKALERNPDVQEELRIYIKALKDDTVYEYIQKFVAPLSS